MLLLFRSARCLGFHFGLWLALMPLTGAAGQPTAAEAREVENLAAFAQAYGYVRFFYPGDAATQVDWDKLAMLGADEVRHASDPAALRSALLRVFQPLAPELRVVAVPAEAGAAKESDRAPRLTFWQYCGMNLNGKPGPYRQVRVIVGADVDERRPLFEPAIAPGPLVRELTPGVVLVMPMALAVEADGTTMAVPSAEFAALLARLAAIDLKVAVPDDWRVRVGGVVTVWSIFQNFHPYLDGAGVRWDETLRPALRRALDEASAEGYYFALSEMIAASLDGHGYVYASLKALGGLPVRVTLAEGQIVVIGVTGDGPLRKGDIIRSVDGIDAGEVLRDRERYTPGSPHLRRFRALHQFGDGPVDRVARIEFVRQGAAEVQVAELSRTGRREYFFKAIHEFTLPAFAEVRPGVFYINLHGLTGPELAAKKEQLAHARGLIFDWRWLGHRPDSKAPSLQVHQDIIPHLIDQPIQASPMRVPQLVAPDRAGWSYRESSWPVKPRAPRFKGKVVFINQPSVVSYGETCMAMIADYRLATLVGDATAGTNGNANFIELPGGFRVMWTGMEVLRHDRSPFYGVGFGPDIPVHRTVHGIREGRDEYLEAAIAFLEGPEVR